MAKDVCSKRRGGEAARYEIRGGRKEESCE